MSGFSHYAQNRINDLVFRGQPFSPPETLHFALLTCSRGQLARTTVYATKDTVAVRANDGAIHLYTVISAGLSGRAEPSFSGAIGEVVCDGGAILMESSIAADAGAVTEVCARSYRRGSVRASLASFAGTQGPGSTEASIGATGITSNNQPIAFPRPSEQWVPGGGAIWALGVYDQPTGGNLLHWAPLAALKISIKARDPAPVVGVGLFTSSIGGGGLCTPPAQPRTAVQS